MGKMKGNSTCHTYSKQGVINHANMKWNNDKCPNQRFMKKNRIICTLNSSIDCVGRLNQNCPLNKV
jgi:hypothetical protein